jgi:hypothetical protein
MARGVATPRENFIRPLYAVGVSPPSRTLRFARDRRKISQVLPGNLRASCFEVKVFTKTEKN